MNNAAWINGKRRITGRWIYNRNSDHFYIELDQRDRITGQNKSLRVYDDTPEWGNWKLDKQET